MFFAALDLGSNTVSTLVRQAKSKVWSVSPKSANAPGWAKTWPRLATQPAAMQHTIAAPHASWNASARLRAAPADRRRHQRRQGRQERRGLPGAMPPELGLCDTSRAFRQIEAELTFRGASDAFQQRRRSSTSTPAAPAPKSPSASPAICALPPVSPLVAYAGATALAWEMSSQKKRLKLRQQPRASCCRRSNSATPWQN